jgi:NADPH-dependent curcumin reductase CurA
LIVEKPRCFMKNRRIVLASRPVGEPKASDFRLETSEVSEPKDQEVLLRNLYLSIDPYMRGRMNEGKSYAKPVEIGGVMEGGTVAEVKDSKHPGFKPGDVVLSYSGWQEYALSDGTGLRKLDPSLAPITTALGVLGMPGLTAYTGLLLIGQPKPNETVCVAAATGPVGSLVGQIAKLKGARAVGIAGGAEKCAIAVKEFGFDVCIDHHSPNFAAELVKAAPNGIDVYFENVGGSVWNAVMPLLNDFARIPVCGLIAHYNDTKPPEGPDRLPGLMMKVLQKRWTIRGFIVSDFADKTPEFQRDMSQWLKEDKVKYREDIVVGLDAAPDALIGVLKGKNFGKSLVKITEE